MIDKHFLNQILPRPFAQIANIVERVGRLVEKSVNTLINWFKLPFISAPLNTLCTLELTNVVKRLKDS